MHGTFPVLWPFLFYSAFVLLIAGGTLAVSWIIGERSKIRKTAIPYESGIPPFGTSRLRIFIRFYIIALLFVLFDLESAFIFAWAISLRDTGWAGLIEMVLFISVLLIALFYLISRKALDSSSPHLSPGQKES